MVYLDTDVTRNGEDGVAALLTAVNRLRHLEAVVARVRDVYADWASRDDMADAAAALEAALVTPETYVGTATVTTPANG